MHDVYTMQVQFENGTKSIRLVKTGENYLAFTRYCYNSMTGLTCDCSYLIIYCHQTITIRAFTQYRLSIILFWAIFM